MTKAHRTLRAALAALTIIFMPLVVGAEEIDPALLQNKGIGPVKNLELKGLDAGLAETGKVAFGAKCLGGKPEDFHGFRFRIKYPPIPTVAFLRHPLMQRP